MTTTRFRRSSVLAPVGVLVWIAASSGLALDDPYANFRSRVPGSAIELPAIGAIRPRPAAEIDASYLGIGCETLGRGYAYYEGYKEYFGNLGVKHARFQSCWAKTEKEPGYYDFTWLDPIIDDCLSRGIQPWMNISYGNPLYPGAGNISIRSPMPQGEAALQAWDAYVRALVTHYKTRIFEWEIWNEPNNHHDPETGPLLYADLFIRSAEIIREVQPEGKTIALAIGFWAHRRKHNFVKIFLDEIQAQDKVHLVDIVSMHGYPKDPDDDRLDGFMELVRSYDERIDFLQGEAGAPSTRTTGALEGTDWSETIQAKWNLRRALMHLGRGIPHSQFAISDMKYPNWREQGVNSKGLLKINEHDMHIERPKEAYFAYQYLTSVFDATVRTARTLKVDLDAPAPAVAYSFTDTLRGGPLVVYWNCGREPDSGVATARAELRIHNAVAESPVLVDLRTGVVYDLPAVAVTRSGESVTLAVPVYDSPLLVCERAFLEDREILILHSGQ